MTHPSNGLPKRNHLTGEKRITTLFKEGDAFLAFPIRVVYQLVPSEEVAIKTLFSVPKRQFKHAVDRNRFKRLMREAFRTQKQCLESQVTLQAQSLHIAFIAINNELPSQEKVNIKMGKALEKICASLTSES